MNGKGIILLLILFLITILTAQENQGRTGIIFNRQNSGYLKIYDLAPAGPAEKAGLKKGDLIVKVNDLDVREHLQEELLQNLQGRVGNSVKLQVLRGNQSLDFNIVRGIVKPWVQREMIEGTIKHGFAKYKEVNGDVYEGPFMAKRMDGNMKVTKPNGEIVKFYAFYGDISESSVEIHYPDGKRYKGYVKEGVPHGKGVMHLADGTTQEGEWFLGRIPVTESCISGDCQNGQGVYLVRNAYQYSGGFKNGKYHGDGVVEYFNPDNTVKKYRGYFKNHKTYGPGHIYYRNGDYYHGEFKSWFKPDGKGKMTYHNGDVYEGDWKDGQRSGYGHLIKTNGDHYAGSFNENQFDGYVASLRNNTVDFQVYEKGKIDKSSENFAKQHLKDVNSVLKDEDSIFKMFVLVTDIYFPQGPLYGDCENGTGIAKLEGWRIYHGPFKNGLPNGNGVLFDGREARFYKCIKGNFTNGKMHGQMKVHVQGQEPTELAYHEGKNNVFWGDKTFTQVDAEKKEQKRKQQEELEAHRARHNAMLEEQEREWNAQFENRERSSSGSSNNSSSNQNSNLASKSQKRSKFFYDGMFCTCRFKLLKPTNEPSYVDIEVSVDILPNGRVKLFASGKFISGGVGEAYLYWESDQDLSNGSGHWDDSYYHDYEAECLECWE